MNALWDHMECFFCGAILGSEIKGAIPLCGFPFLWNDPCGMKSGFGKEAFL